MGKPTRVVVYPGACRFECVIVATREGRWKASFEIRSQCEHIQRFFQLLKAVNVQELFAPLDRNAVFRASEQAGCHPSCPVPVAVAKAAEVCLEMAVPCDVEIRFCL